MASSSSSSLISIEKKNYEVFLSFRGEDTRRSFTGHLCKALRDKQIQTYMDEDTLEKGDEISPSLWKAIEESKLSVVVISENYASSSWCLSELNHILQCKERANQLVVPIFYRVDPSIVRHQRGSFAEEFAKHEERFKDEMEKVHQWRKALTDVANLSGFHTSTNGSESDSRLIEKIVEDILNKLNSMSPPSDDLEDLFGIEKHIEKMESFLNIGSEDIRIVGIWGMGGLGKTTLARAVYDKISSHFQRSLFLENVKDQVKGKQPSELQNEVVSKLIGEKEKLENVTQFVKIRLQRTKVLFVLDDVDCVDQLEHLAKNRNWFGHGSRIIITTRDLHILECFQADEKHKMTMMDNDDAVRFFYSKAFRGEPNAEYAELSKRVVAYAQGNPLTLKVLGSHLYQKSIKEWESELEKLKIIPNKKVLDVLKISYDGLSSETQSIFLDIACFFPHERKSIVEKILSYRHSGVVMGIRILIDKSLIIEGKQNDEIWMHDLLRDTGREIVRQESIDYPEERSRLCSTRDACRVLENNLGTRKVQGLALYLPEMEDDLSLKPTVFKEMRNLWFLKLYGHAQSKCKINIPEDLQLPDTLIYLRWDGFTSQSLPPDFMSNNLVELEMLNNSLKQLGNGVKLFKKLKVLNLGYSKSLTLTDLSCAPNLERIDLTGCSRIHKFPVFSNLNCIKHLDMSLTSVEEVPPSIEYLSSLIELNLGSCRRLKSLPSNIYKLKSLTELFLYGCSEFEYFPEILEPMECLQMLNLRETKIRELPQSIEKMTGLVDLYLDYCEKLEIIPHTIHNLHSLEYLRLEHCTNLKSLPRLPLCVEYLSAEGCTSLTLIDHFSAPNLEERNFNDCSSKLPGPFSARNIECSYMPGKAIEEVSSSITEYPSHHRHFMFQKCTRLKSLPISILKSLRILSLDGCSELEYFPEIEEPIYDLVRLNLERTGIKELPLSIKNLCGLKYLFLDDCDALEIVPHTISDIPLEMLTLRRCKKIKSLPELPSSLNLFFANHCESLEKVSFPWNGLTEGPRNNIVDQKFHFYDCKKLDLESMLTQFKTRVFGAIHVSNSNCTEELKRYAFPAIRICFPGSNIPEWFDRKYCNEALKNVSLPPDWCKDNFMGFALCLVIGLKHNVKTVISDEYFSLLCTVYSKTESGEKRLIKSHKYVQAIWLEPLLPDFGDQMIMWSIDVDYGDLPSLEEVSFEFDCQKRFETEVFEVKGCGIRMLYLQEAKEFRISHNKRQQRESNIVTDEAEPSDRGTSDSDTDQPHQKRTKLF